MLQAFHITEVHTWQKHSLSTILMSLALHHKTAAHSSGKHLGSKQSIYSHSPWTSELILKQIPSLPGVSFIAGEIHVQLGRSAPQCHNLEFYPFLFSTSKAAQQESEKYQIEAEYISNWWYLWILTKRSSLVKSLMANLPYFTLK